MTRPLDRLLREHALSLGLAVGWTASWFGLRALDEAPSQRLLLAASTTVPHLLAWPVTLPVSGLVVPAGLPIWLVSLPLGVVVVEREVGPRSALALMAGVHVAATAVSQALLGLRVAGGSADSSLLHQVDVGPSLLTVAGLAGALVLTPRLSGRLLAAGALLLGAPELVRGLRTGDLAATGHLAALLLGLAGAARLRRAQARTVPG